MSFFMGSPEDAERHRAIHENARHEANRLFFELSDDQLRILEMIFTAISNSNDTSLAAWNAGRIEAIRELKFGVCGGCGRNHSEDAANLAESEDDKPETPAFVDARRKAEESQTTPIGATTELTDAEKVRMAEYDLDDLREEGTFRLLGFVCLNCGMTYVSIDDRMLKSPGKEGCGGCIQKEKWG